MTGMWCLEGWNTPEGRPYPLQGQFETEADAQDAARLRLAELEMTQPTEETGGQDLDGIQHHVYVVRPDGSRYRFIEFVLQD